MNTFPYKPFILKQSGNIYNFKVFELIEEKIESISKSAGVYILADESKYSKGQHLFLKIDKTENLQETAKEFLTAKNILHSGQLSFFTCEVNDNEKRQLVLSDALSLYGNQLPTSIFSNFNE